MLSVAMAQLLVFLMQQKIQKTQQEGGWFRREKGPVAGFFLYTNPPAAAPVPARPAHPVLFLVIPFLACPLVLALPFLSLSFLSLPGIAFISCPNISPPQTTAQPLQS